MHKITIEVKIKQFYHLILFSFYLVLDLLQSGADPCTADKYGRTPLHVASTKLDAAIGKS
jgi:ankyrin repeat protein